MTVEIIVGDAREALRGLADCSVNCVVTSPPYFGLRDYDVDGQMGLEPTPADYVAGMVALFQEVRRVLRDDGTLWLNIGDSYATKPRGNREGDLSTSGLTNPERQDKLWGKHKYREQDREPRIRNLAGVKEKDLIGIPWMLAFALRADGWFLRQDIIWSKPNPMPESVRDRCTKAHEYLFLMTKGRKYFYDSDAIAEPATGQAPGNTKATKGGRAYAAGAGEHRTAANLHNIVARDTRNRRSVWEIASQPFAEAHFATFPPALVEPCILAGCPAGGTVLDPFGGAGTTGLVADSLQRNAVLIELNPAYAEMARARIRAALGQVKSELPEPLAAGGPLFDTVGQAVAL